MIFLIVFAIIAECQGSQQSYDFTKRELQQGNSLLSVPYSSLNEIVLGDNEVSSVPLPWGGFPYFNGVYSSAYISSNGLVTFGDTITSASILDERSSITNIPKFQQQQQVSTDVTYNVVLHRSTKAIHVRLLSADIKHRHLDRHDSEFSIHVHKQLNHLRMLTIKNPSTRALSYLKNHPDVLSVELDSEVEMHGGIDANIDELRSKILQTAESSSSSSSTSSSSRYLESTPYYWGLDRCDQADLPLDMATYVSPSYAHKGNGVDVYIVDSGLMTSHVEFGSVPGYPREVKNVWDAYIPNPTSPDVDNDNNGE
jgi:hypothetical protein